MSDLIRQLNDEMSAAVQGVRRALVEIHNGHGGAGAGTIWHADGLIITNAHVVRRRRGLKVTLPDKRTFPARLLAHDDQHDLAALSVDATGLPTIQLGDSRLLKAGQWVMAIGHPYGIAGAVTAGIVIGEGAQLPEMAASGREWIAVSLHMRPGHSGGPLVDIDGRLVGINTMITGPDVGMAVPVHVVKAFLRQAGLGDAVEQSAAKRMV
ncbi:MAG: trypsin-like peptidase domain-containing protein [Chloroflexota bacterium]|nr:trypsin-like peptidase domain-containing protein [Chloroflexota bacterium]